MNSPIPAVKLHAKGCTNVVLPLQLDRVVTGKVVGRSGLPVAGVIVEAVPFRARRPNDEPRAVDESVTDADGRYELRNLPAGDYYLGTSLSHRSTVASPYARWFYRGTEDPRAAVLVNIGDKAERQTFDFVLPDPQKRRIIEGTVGWPDGRAAVARILLEDPRWPWQVPTFETVSDGRFTFEVLDGTRYRIHAVTVCVVWAGGYLYCSCCRPVHIHCG